jgi:hypothetical protein
MAVIATALCAVFVFATSAAALDPSYLSEFPDPSRITQDFQGADRLDTLALQIAALNRLSMLVAEMAGDRYYTPGKYPTPDEARVLAAIRATAEPLGAEAEATLRGQWRPKVTAYQRSDELYARLMQLYFTPAFRAAHEAKLAARAALQQKGRDELERGRRALNGEKDPVPGPDYGAEILFGVAMLGLCLFGGLRMFRDPTLTKTPPYRFWVGLRRYTIEAATGTIGDYSHREIFREIEHTGKYTHNREVAATYESFTLDGPQGKVPIELESTASYMTQRVLEAAVGQTATVLWTARKGSRLYLSVYVHSHPSVERIGATENTFEALFPRPYWTIAAFVLLAFVIGDLGVGAEYSGAIAGLIAMPVWEVLYRTLLSRRSSAFQHEQVIPLVKSLAGVTLTTR